MKYPMRTTCVLAMLLIGGVLSGCGPTDSRRPYTAAKENAESTEVQTGESSSTPKAAVTAFARSAKTTPARLWFSESEVVDAEPKLLDAVAKYLQLSEPAAFDLEEGDDSFLSVQARIMISEEPAKTRRGWVLTEIKVHTGRVSTLKFRIRNPDGESHLYYFKSTEKTPRIAAEGVWNLVQPFQER